MVTIYNQHPNLIEQNLFAGLYVRILSHTYNQNTYNLFNGVFAPAVFVLGSEEKSLGKSAVSKLYQLWILIVYERSHLHGHSTICVIS